MVSSMKRLTTLRLSCVNSDLLLQTALARIVSSTAVEGGGICGDARSVQVECFLKCRTSGGSLNARRREFSAFGDDGGRFGSDAKSRSFTPLKIASFRMATHFLAE